MAVTIACMLLIGISWLVAWLGMSLTQPEGEPEQELPTDRVTYDKVWGVGMTADDPRFANPAKWQGENLLGRTCMRVRADLRQLIAMGKLDEARHESLELDPTIAGMTLLQLSRIPAARAAVYCYATIVSHAVPHIPSAGAYLKMYPDATVDGILYSMLTNMGAGLPVTGWYELIRELEIQHVLGRL